MALSEQRIRELASEGWRCADYAGEVPDEMIHPDETHLLVETDHPNHTPELDMSGNAVKLHLGDMFMPEKDELGVDIGGKTAIREMEESGEGTVSVPPGRFVFFVTEEMLWLPFDVDGRLSMNPHIANDGILIFTTGHIAPGSAVRPTGTLLNMTEKTKHLTRGDSIFYLVLSEIGGPSVHDTHDDPRETIVEARAGRFTHPDPSFALATEFVTKSDLYKVAVLAATLVGLIVGALQILLA